MILGIQFKTILTRKVPAMFANAPLFNILQKNISDIAKVNVGRFNFDGLIFDSADTREKMYIVPAVRKITIRATVVKACYLLTASSGNR